MLRASKYVVHKIDTCFLARLLSVSLRVFGSLCRAALSLAGFMWFSCWQACIAINIWLTVVFQAKKQLMNQVRAAFIPTSTVLTILAPVVCLAGQNVGYDWAGYSGTSATSCACPLLCGL